MAGLAITPKLLHRISNEEYQEKGKWKIDDIALGPANELLISGHNLDTPKTFVSMYKEYSGKYDNRPEFNNNFDQTQPGEQLVLILEDSSIIGLKVESALHFLRIEDRCVFKIINLRRPPTSVCVYRGTLYAASSTSKIVSACNLHSEDETNIILSDMKSDCVLEIVVLMEKIYVCTKYDGRALVFGMTGSKKMEFKNATQSDAMATSICIHDRTEIVFVLWNNIQIQLYSQKTSRCLCALDMTEQLHKICVTSENILITSSASKCIVTVYDVAEAIHFGDCQNNILSSVKKKHRKKLISHDAENLDSHPADFETLSFPWKSASKQSYVEQLRDTKELYKKQLEENENRRRKYDRDMQRLKDEIDRSKKEKDDVTEVLENTRSNLSRKEADLSDVKVKLDDSVTESDGLRRMNKEKEEKCCSLTKQLEEEKKTTEELKNDINRRKKEMDDAREELENTKSNLFSKEANLSDVQARLDASMTKSDGLRRMKKEKEEKCCSLTKQLAAEKKTTEELKHDIIRSEKEKDDVRGELENTRSILFSKESNLSDVQAELDAERINKDTVAVSTEILKTEIMGLMDGMNAYTMELTKTNNDVTKELKISKSTLTEKEKELLKIQQELEDAILKKKNLEETAKETHKLTQIIEAKETEIKQLQNRLNIAEKEVKNAKTQVTILQERKNELVKFVSREQTKSKELEGLLSSAKACSFEYNTNITQLEDANSRLKNEHDKDEKTQTLLSKILENLDRDALVLKTESEIVKKILQTKGKQQDMLVCLQSDFNSRIEKLKRETELLEYKMGQQNKIIDFEKKNRSALPDIVEQSCTYNDKQEVTAMGLEHKALSDNANTLEKELRGPMTQTSKENKKELVEKGSTEENVSKLHHDSNLIPLTLKRLPEDEQMLETRKEGVTEMTSFQEGTNSRLEQLQNFRVTKEKRQLYFIEKRLQGVQDKVKYETFQYEYFKDMFESRDNLLGVLQQSKFLKTVDALVKEISNGKDELGKLKDNQDNTVEEYEVQRDWLELHELQVSLVVSQDGGKLKIPGSDVSLDIPPGAMQEQCEIQMKIIPHCLDPGGDPISFSSNSSVVVELLPNKLQFQRTVHLRLPHCLHLNENYNSLKDAKVLISHHDKDDAPNWDVSTDTECKLETDHCLITLKKFCWITCRVDDKIVTAKRLKIFTAGRDLELSDRVSEVEVGYFPDLPGSGEILRKNPKLGRGQIKPFLFHKNEEGSPLQISLLQVIPSEWQNESSLGDKQIISYQSICTGTEMSCPFHLQYTPEGSPRGKVPLCLFHASQENAEQINITFRPEVKCDED